MKLNKTRVGILSLCGVLALAGVGASVAYVFNAAKVNESVTNDSAIVLDWGSNSLSDIADLTPAAPQFQSVTYQVSKSAGVTSGFAKMTFTLAKDETATGDFEVYVGTQTFEAAQMPSEETYKLLQTSSDTKTCTYLADITDEEPTVLYLKYVALGETAVSYKGTLTVSLAYETSGNEGWAA